MHEDGDGKSTTLVRIPLQMMCTHPHQNTIKIPLPVRGSLQLLVQKEKQQLKIEFSGEARNISFLCRLQG